MSVSYNGNKIIPAPLVSITKEYQKSENGDIIGKIFRLTITGTLVTHMGSPNSTGTFWTLGGYPPDESIVHDSRMGAILRKQEALRALFATEGQSFEIQPLDGTQPIKCYPRVLDISFAEAIWVDRCDYTINLEADELYPKTEDSFLSYINSANESWQLETDETPENIDLPRTYRLTHTVSAQGKKVYDELGALTMEAWQQARKFVLPKLGFDSAILLSSGVNNLPAFYGGYNHTRSEEIDKKGGNYSVTENWLIASGTALESYEISVESNTEDPITKVGIRGEITGLEQRNNNLQLTVSKYTNANTKFNQIYPFIFTRAQTYSGLSLNVLPRTQSVSRSPVAGTISYSYDYDNRPTNLISGAKSETISLTDDFDGGQKFASIFVLGRAHGPVLQALNTKEALTRQLTLEAVVTPETFGDLSQSAISSSFMNNPRRNPATSGDINKIIEAANPNNLGGYSKVFREQPSETWEPKTGRYSYSIKWTFEV